LRDGLYIPPMTMRGDEPVYGDVYLVKTDSQGIEEWSRTFGGSGNDSGMSVQEASDGGYIISGSTWSFGAGGGDVYLVKTDSLGIEEWSTTFGGSEYDYGSSVQETSDGGYIIAGLRDGLYIPPMTMRGDEPVYGDVYLVKVDSQGIEEWSRTFGGSDDDGGWSVQVTSDGGYVIAGWTYSFGAGGSDAYLVKTDSLGLEEWSTTFGGSGYDDSRSVQVTSDGGYILAGITWPLGANRTDVYLVKVDSLGSESEEDPLPPPQSSLPPLEEWSRTFGGSEEDYCYSVQETSDGGFILAGETKSFGAGEFDVYLVKTDSQGVEEWSRTFGGLEDDVGYSVQETIDGGYIIVGDTLPIDKSDCDGYLVKVDSQGIEEWSRTFGGSGDDSGYSVQETIDGGYIITGETNSFGANEWEVYLVKTDSQGVEEWSRTFGGPHVDVAYSVQETIEGGYIIAGET